MGYSYFGSGPNRGKLCCDHCPDGVGYKRPCPFGWCPPSALCAKCWRDPEVRVRFDRYHVEAECARWAAEYRAREARKAQLLADGCAVRSAALSTHTGDRVHVLFTRADETTIGFYMPHAVYDAILILEPATPDDYRRRGAALLGCDPAEVLTEAPPDFFEERTTKRAA